MDFLEIFRGKNLEKKVSTLSQVKSLNLRTVTYYRKKKTHFKTIRIDSCRLFRERKSIVRYIFSRRSINNNCCAIFGELEPGPGRNTVRYSKLLK